MDEQFDAVLWLRAEAMDCRDEFCHVSAGRYDAVADEIERLRAQNERLRTIILYGESLRRANQAGACLTEADGAILREYRQIRLAVEAAGDVE